MKTRVVILSISVFFMSCVFTGMTSAQPVDIDWLPLNQVELESPALDVEITPDNDLIFVLLSGKVVVYEKTGNRQLNQIPVDERYNRLAYAAETEALVLTSSISNALKVIHIDRVYDISIEGSPFSGPENAPVTIIVFDDYECQFCAKMEAVFSQLQAKYPKEVKLVIKQFPLRSHANARQSAIAAMAAHKQGKFWEFHSQLFAHQKELSDQKLDEIAKSFDLDMNQYYKDLISQDILALIVRDIREGQKIGVKGTPSIYLNGKEIKNRTFSAMDKLIELELAK